MSKSITADELLLMPGSKHLELVRGEIVRVSLTGFQHSVIASQLAQRIGAFVSTRGLGLYYASKIGFCIERNPDTVRAADGVFLRMERVCALGDHHGYVDGAPDLAIEVLSPTDRRSDLLARCRAWITAGSEMVVLVDPDRHSAIVFTPTGETELDEHATLRFEPVLPDLALPLAELFASGASAAAEASPAGAHGLAAVQAAEARGGSMDRMASRSVTAHELLLMPRSRRCELVRGEIVDVSPAGLRHGVIVAALARIIGTHVFDRGLGLYVAGEAGFWIERNPDTVRAPDGAFLRAERARDLGDHRGYVDGAPDLAMEVLSPTDRRSAAVAKCRAWVAAGAQMAVLFDPDRRTATVFTPTGETELDERATLRFEPVLPGLALPLAQLFA